MLNPVHREPMLMEQNINLYLNARTAPLVNTAKGDQQDSKTVKLVMNVPYLVIKIHMDVKIPLAQEIYVLRDNFVYQVKQLKTVVLELILRSKDLTLLTRV